MKSIFWALLLGGVGTVSMASAGWGHHGYDPSWSSTPVGYYGGGYGGGSYVGSGGGYYGGSCAGGYNTGYYGGSCAGGSYGGNCGSYHHHHHHDACKGCGDFDDDCDD